MLDKTHIGAVVQDFSTDVEAGRLRFFAKATGQTDPLYFDPEFARQRGYPGLPVPPTFFLCLESESTRPLAVYELLGIELGRVLHGEQSFTYHRMAFAGERLNYQTRIVDLYEKKGGALDFVVTETSVTGERGEPVADLRGVIVVRNG